jgi:hypothetical protein
MVLYGSSFINLIFAPRGLVAALAHVGLHCVAGIALPPVDATVLLFFIVLLAAREGTRKRILSHPITDLYFAALELLKPNAFFCRAVGTFDHSPAKASSLCSIAND